MKRTWGYLLAVFLLAAGMLTGCAEKAVSTENAPNAEAGVRETEIEEAEVPEAGTGLSDAELVILHRQQAKGCYFRVEKVLKKAAEENENLRIRMEQTGIRR